MVLWMLSQKYTKFKLIFPLDFPTQSIKRTKTACKSHRDKNQFCGWKKMKCVTRENYSRNKSISHWTWISKWNVKNKWTKLVEDDDWFGGGLDGEYSLRWVFCEKWMSWFSLPMNWWSQKMLKFHFYMHCNIRELVPYVTMWFEDFVYFCCYLLNGLELLVRLRRKRQKQKVQCRAVCCNTIVVYGRRHRQRQKKKKKECTQNKQETRASHNNNNYNKKTSTITTTTATTALRNQSNANHAKNLILWHTNGTLVCVCVCLCALLCVRCESYGERTKIEQKILHKIGAIRIAQFICRVAIESEHVI